ncbi:head-tail connector protein [Ruminiclostridium papyrosolvens]|uniref:DNA-packaging protein n=1 Tax=Ruminiclostridium papyrosolvens C7 TaxID=1330534 RepID=U4R2C3_9FIRM|nr:head-tail connector protein [Ruminiclostridium papyrosolvens]EPR12494.1 hypothetical protein L323_08045 [Ruminiclostridium papyrosolvens C7]
MALIDDVKLSLRIKTDAFDDEINPLIEACKIDLKLAGVNVIEETDPLIKRAVILYAKANFGYSEDSEKYKIAYDMQKNSLALSQKYNTIAATTTETIV